MSKTLGLLLTCFIVLIFWYFFLQSQPIRQTVSTKTFFSPKPTVTSQAKLHFLPNNSTLTSLQNESLSITIDAEDVKPTMIQLELGYNPLLLQNITITPGNFFSHPYVLLNAVDTISGRISYAVQTTGGKDRVQSGTIAILNFIPVTTFIPLQTSLTFFPKTVIRDNNGQVVPVATSEAKITILPQIHTLLASQSAKLR